MRITNLTELVEELRTYLPNYLQSQGIKTNRKFNCINPAHDEKSPSCSLVPKSDNTTAHCFGCTRSFDIYTAAHWLESLPVEGPGFIDTVTTLAERFKLEVHTAEFSEQDKQLAAAREAYADAAEYLGLLEKQSSWTQSVEDYISSHNWTKSHLSSVGVGVGSKEGLIDYMTGCGYTTEYMHSIGLLSVGSQVIEEDRLVFTIKDEHGRPCGFAARKFNDKPKYINQSMGGIAATLYNKGSRLYGIDVAKADRTKPLYIFEGYGDVVTAQLHGLRNCCAAGGTAITVEQLLLAKKLGFRTIIIALDWDDGGYIATERICSTVLPEVKDLNFRILISDLEHDDPGTFIEKEGIERFLSLEQASPFNWTLTRKLKSGAYSGEELAASMVPIVALEQSAIVRESKTKELSKITGVSTYAIDTEVRKLVDQKERERTRAEEAVIERLHNNLTKSPEDKSGLLSKALQELEEITTEFTGGRFSAQSCLTMLETQKEIEDNIQESDTQGFKLSIMPQLMTCFSDGKDWSTDTLMLLGGQANAGKSSFMASFCFDIAYNNEDAVTLYFSIDDSGRDLLPKFIANAHIARVGYIPTAPGEELSLGAIVNPNKWIQRLPIAGDRTKLLDARDQAYQTTRDLMTDERLVLKDGSDGKTLAYMESVIRYYRARFPTRRIFAVVDNTHNLHDYNGMDLRERFSTIADRMNDICNQYRVCLMASVEYRKKFAGGKGGKVLPVNDDIAESRAFAYRAKWIGHIYNDMHERPDDYDTFHLHPVYNKPLPRILLVHAKSKINGFKGITVHDFHPHLSAFRWKDEAEAKMESEKYIKIRKEEQEQEEQEEQNEERW